MEVEMSARVGGFGRSCSRSLDSHRLLAGRVAGRKGHSFFGYLIFSQIFFPAALIVAYLVRDRRAMG
jgi:hypothetical protein